MARPVNGCEAQAALHFLFLFLLVVLSFLLAGLQHFVSNCAGNGLINLRQGYGLLFKVLYSKVNSEYPPLSRVSRNVVLRIASSMLHPSHPLAILWTEEL
jgi:hypothetical protein